MSKLKLIIDRSISFFFKVKWFAYAHFVIISLLLFCFRDKLSQIFFTNWLHILTGNVGESLLWSLVIIGCLIPFAFVVCNKGSALFASLAASITSLCLSPLIGIIFLFSILGESGSYGDVAMLALPFGILGSITLGIVILPLLYALFFCIWMTLFARHPSLRGSTRSLPLVLRFLSLGVLIGVVVLFSLAHPYRASWTLHQMGEATWIDQNWDQKSYIRDPVIQRLQFLADSREGYGATGYEENTNGSITNANWLLERAVAKPSLQATMQPILLTAFRNEKSPLREQSAQLLFKQRDPSLRNELIQYAAHSSLVNMFGTYPDDPYITEKDVEPIRREVLKGR